MNITGCKLFGGAVFLWILSLGCAPSLLQVKEAIQSHPDQGHAIQGVPFYPQTDLACGPSALASVLNFFGNYVSEEEIAQEIVNPRIGGALNLDLYLYAREKGMKAEVLKGGLVSLKEEIRKGHPVIAFLNLGYRLYPFGHYIVVFGYDDNEQALIAHWGTEENRIITFRRFLAAWRKTGEWALLVLPP